METVNEKSAVMNPAERMRIRLAAEGYKKFKEDSSADEAVEKQSFDRQRSKSRGSCSTQRLLKMALVITVLLIIVLLIIVLYSLSRTKVKTCDSSECVEVAGHLIRSMNLSANPCQDFYNYACGNWQATTVVPPDQGKWNSFKIDAEANLRILQKILGEDENLVNGEESDAVRKAKLYYSACMNTSAISARGSSPMIQFISELDGWPILDSGWNGNGWQLENVLAKHHIYGNPLFAFGVSADDKNSTANIIYFDQEGLLYGQPDFYLGNSSATYRDAEIQLITSIARLLGATGNVEQDAEEIYNFELELAKIFDPKEDRIDPAQMYHKMELQDLQDSTGDWLQLDDYLKEIFGQTIPMSESILVFAPNYFEKVEAVYKAHSKRQVANYMTWITISGFITYLPEGFLDAYLEWKKAIYGIQSLPETWKTCVTQTDAGMPYTTGALFVEQEFSESWKIEAEAILTGIQQSFTESLPNVEWMDAVTLSRALDKVRGLNQKIGYPELTVAELDEKYNSLTITGNSFTNAKHIQEYNTQRVLNDRGKPVDWSRWDMSASEVNAYYQANQNVMVFPAGILQRPFFDSKFPQALNYGGIGMVMGHELTHGFDNKGRNYDKYGNMNNWWTDESAAAFQEKTNCLVDQYSQFPIGDEFINGELTLSENIADNSGLKTAFNAYQKWLKHHDFQEPEAILPGLNLSENQLFFLGMAQVWCSYSTPEYALQALTTDVHTDPHYRVLGTLQNSADFAHAYHCPADTPMNPSNKCTLW